MSHFSTIQTQMVSVPHLLQALHDLGHKNVEVHENPEALYGFQGDVRRQKAEVIIRRKFIGGLSNDIGFARNEQGALDAIISDFDLTKYNSRWLGTLTQRYAYHAIKEQLKEQDFNMVEEEVQPDSTIHLVVRRMV